MKLTSKKGCIDTQEKGCIDRNVETWCIAALCDQERGILLFSHMAICCLPLLMQIQPNACHKEYYWKKYCPDQ